MPATEVNKEAIEALKGRARIIMPTDGGITTIHMDRQLFIAIINTLERLMKEAGHVEGSESHTMEVK